MNIEEIAKKARVSRSTVSRVLNNQPTVKEETRRAVQKVIEEMNYVPNAAARSLASKRNNIIGVLVYNIVQPFWASMFSGIEQGMSGSDYGIFLANSKSHLNIMDYQNDYRKNLKNLVLRGVDGIIIALANDLCPEDIDFLEASGVPFVIIQNHLDDRRVASVNVDNVTGAYRATRHLIQLGHRRIVHAAGPLDSGIYQDRRRGFLNAMEEAGIPVYNDSVVHCGSLFNDGYWCMKRLVSQKSDVTAILFTNDVSAFGAYMAAREEKVSIPGDFSIVGFDMLAEQMDVSGLLPDLTTMRQPVGQIGAAAAQMLLRQLESGDSGESMVFPFELHEGSTSRRIGGPEVEQP